MAWPTSLPAPMLSGYSASGKQPVERVKMTAGPDRVTRTSSTSIITVKMRIVMDTAQKRSDLLSFYDGEANAGANWVNVPIDTGQGLVNHRIRFVDEPVPIPKGNGVYIAVCSVETDEKNS